MSSFKDIGFFFVHNNLEAEAQRSSKLNDKTKIEHVHTSFGLLPEGYCEQKPVNVEKTTSSVLSVLLFIYA